MKKHSLFSYFFWASMAAFCGIIGILATINGIKFSFNLVFTATEPIIYEARAEEKEGNGKEKLASDNFSQYKIRKKNTPLVLSASSYLVADIETGKIIFEKNKNASFPIASITKLMTAVVYMESEKKHQTAIVSKSASIVTESKSGLREGQIIPSSELVYPLLLESSNVSAETIAEQAGRKEFIRKMNAKAFSMGLKNTFFDDPSGISSLNKSTASDIFKLISYINKNKQTIFEITTKKEYDTGWRVWINNDKFTSLENFLGGKTGFTNAAGQTFAGIFSLPLSEIGNRKIAVILLRSNNREEDAFKIFDYMENNLNYETNI